MFDTRTLFLEVVYSTRPCPTILEIALVNVAICFVVGFHCAVNCGGKQKEQRYLLFRKIKL